MIKKEIKEYKQRDKTIQRINILKKDNISGTVYILEEQEYNSLQNELKELKENTNIQQREDKTIKEIIEVHQKLVKDLSQQQDKTIREMNKEHQETTKSITKQQHELTEKITKEHYDQLKQTYDEFNNELKKYITVNQLQNTALKQILELGFIDLIRNKHKKIAKNQIKELSTKPVYELTKKE